MRRKKKNNNKKKKKKKKKSKEEKGEEKKGNFEWSGSYFFGFFMIEDNRVMRTEGNKNKFDSKTVNAVKSKIIDLDNFTCLYF